MKIRADILRTYQVIHSWTGIISGLLLFIGFFAGAIILFQSTITNWATPVGNNLSPIAIEKYDTLLQQTFETYPQTQRQLQVNFSPTQSPVIWSELPQREIHLVEQKWHGTLDEHDHIKTATSQPNLLATLIDQLHRTAGLAGEVGHEHWGAYVLGIASVLYFLALISGLIFLLPTLVKHFFALRSNKGAARFWLDIHNLLGITSFPFHIIISFTVVVFVFHDFFYVGLQPIYGDKAMFSRPAPSAEPYNTAQLPPLNRIVERAEQAAPGYEVDHIAFSGLNSNAPMAMIGVTSDKHFVRGPYVDYIFMHPYTFEVHDFGNAHKAGGVWAKIVRAFFALHFGSFGGDSARWLYFFLGISGAIIFYSGNLLWLEKKYQKKQQVQTKSVQTLAKLTVAVPLGSMLGVAMAFALSKVLVLSQVSINHAYLVIYYSCFVSAMLFTFIQGHIVAAITLNYLLAATLFAIPLSSLLLHTSDFWPVNQSNNWWIDIMAFAFAIVFFKIATKTRHRAQQGDPYSLWSSQSLSNASRPVSLPD